MTVKTDILGREKKTGERTLLLELWCPRCKENTNVLPLERRSSRRAPVRTSAELLEWGESRFLSDARESTCIVVVGCAAGALAVARIPCAA